MKNPTIPKMVVLLSADARKKVAGALPVAVQMLVRRHQITFAVLVILTLTYSTFYFLIRITANDDIQCYRVTGPTLPDMASFRPRKSRGIYFHETSCDSHREGKIVISSRQACAVESAARLNPNRDIFLIYASPGLIKYEGTESDDFLRVLQSYSNVNIVHVDVEKYVEDTWVEELYLEKKLDKSKFAKQHASDVLRYLTLWKYGGIYLDLDIIVLRSLEGLQFNFVAIESDLLVASGVLGFTHRSAGHILLTQCLKDLQYNFDGAIWAKNGPGVITKVAKRVCAAEDVFDLVGAQCIGDLTVLPTEAFYPVPWWNWTVFFDIDAKEWVENVIRDSYTVHVWNKLSGEIKVTKNGDFPYLDIVRKQCPKVYEQSREYF